MYNLERHEEAIGYYDRALAIEPKDARALNNKAMDLYSLGRYDEAIQYIDKVLLIDPTNLYALTTKVCLEDIKKLSVVLCGIKHQS